MLTVFLSKQWPSCISIIGFLPCHGLLWGNLFLNVSGSKYNLSLNIATWKSHHSFWHRILSINIGCSTGVGAHDSLHLYSDVAIVGACKISLTRISSLIVGDTRQLSCNIHEHFCKRIRWVGWYAYKTSKALTSKIQNVIWCYQNQLYFVHIFFIMVCCRIATGIRISYKACDEKMLKSWLILILLKISSRYQWYCNSTRNCYYITIINKKLHWK